MTTSLVIDMRAGDLPKSACKRLSCASALTNVTLRGHIHQRMLQLLQLHVLRVLVLVIRGPWHACHYAALAKSKTKTIDITVARFTCAMARAVSRIEGLGYVTIRRATIDKGALSIIPSHISVVTADGCEDG